jgi:DNA-binding CsgD family transcriptional regulator/PAS domain-containing protein
MHSLSNKSILNLIATLYDAAKDQSFDGWSDVYRQLSALLSSGPGSLSFYSPDRKRFDLFVSTLDQELFREYYQHITPFRRQLRQMTTGDRFNRADYCGDKEFLKTEIYQDYFRRQDVFNYEYRVLFKKGETAAGIAFSRPRGMKNFGTRDYALLDSIIPHLQKAFQIYLKFAEIRYENEILSECFEKISQSIIVLNKSGKVVFMNESAKQFVEAKDGLQTDRNGILSTNSPYDTKKLKTILGNVLEPAIKTENNVLQVSRKSALRPLSVFVAPFSENNGAPPTAEKLALLFINDPERQVADIEPVLGRIYGLTLAESKIAVMLAQGKSVNEACGILEIKQNTIRTHLKRIFSKTETSRQSELVKLILSETNSIKNISNKRSA